MVADKKKPAKEEKETRKPARAAKPAPRREPVEASAPAERSAAPADDRNALQKRREVIGTVVSDKMQKTIVVRVDRRVKHGMYAKYVMKSRKFKAHDEKNDAKTGDLVMLVESRPLSRDKRWVLSRIVRRGGQTPEANA